MIIRIPVAIRAEDALARVLSLAYEMERIMQDDGSLSVMLGESENSVSDDEGILREFMFGRKIPGP